MSIEVNEYVMVLLIFMTALVLIVKMMFKKN